MGERLRVAGECIKACDYGVNPRFLLNDGPNRHGAHGTIREQRSVGVEGFRNMARDVT